PAGRPAGRGRSGTRRRSRPRSQSPIRWRPTPAARPCARAPTRRRSDTGVPASRARRPDCLPAPRRAAARRPVRPRRRPVAPTGARHGRRGSPGAEAGRDPRRRGVVGPARVRAGPAPARCPSTRRSAADRPPRRARGAGARPARSAARARGGPAAARRRSAGRSARPRATHLPAARAEAACAGAGAPPAAPDCRRKWYPCAASNWTFTGLHWQHIVTDVAVHPRTRRPPARAAARAALRNDVVIAGIALLAAYDLALAVFMAAWPHAFYVHVGPFGLRNDHYIRD